MAVNLPGDKSKLSGVETRRGNITLTLLLLLLPSYTLTLAGCIANSNAIPPENLEAIAQGIDKSLICPICPSETIDQAQVELAKQMRKLQESPGNLRNLLKNMIRNPKQHIRRFKKT